MRYSAMVATALGLLAGSLATQSPCAAQSLVTTAAPIPDTPAGKRFAELLAAFNSGNDDDLKAYLRAADPSDKDAPDLFVSVYSDTGPLIPFEVRSTGPDEIFVTLAQRNTDSFDSIELQVDPAEPHRIVVLTPHGVYRPANAPPIPTLSEAQLLVALKSKLDRDAAADIFSGALLLAHDGKPVFEYAHGLEDRERGIPITTQTRFGMASISKVFITISIMQMVQAGKIDLDAPIGRYLPDYPNAATASNVTVNELLTHTGGTGDFFGEAFDRHRAELRTPADYIALFGNRDPLFEPGSRRAYSNFGFTILSRLIERVSGQRWDDYERDHIFLPTGMTRTGTLQHDVDHARDYTLQGGELVLMPSKTGDGPYTTTGDLLKFSNALLAGRLLDRAHTELLLYGKAMIGGHSYAYDMSGKAENGALYIGHQGGGRGENGDFRAFPGNGYTLIIFNNFGPPWQKFAQFVSNRLPVTP